MFSILTDTHVKGLGGIQVVPLVSCYTMIHLIMLAVHAYTQRETIYCIYTGFILLGWQKVQHKL